MASFLSESYPKPKLMEPRLINKIIDEQNNKITFEKKAKIYIKNIIIKYWQLIAVVLVIIGLFYWRYREIQNKRRNENQNNRNNKKGYQSYESDSEDVTTEE